MNELTGLLDAAGTVVRRRVPRDDAKRFQGLYIPIVIAVITNRRGEVLVHQRALTKRVNPGDIDHVCGGMLSGESPEAAALREAMEEVGLAPECLRVVRQGVNSYSRYCYLLSGYTDKLSGTQLDPAEVSWAAFWLPEELRSKHKAGVFTFVDGFFEDLDYALSH